MNPREHGQTLINQGFRLLSDEARKDSTVNPAVKQEIDFSAVCHAFFEKNRVYDVVTTVAGEVAQTGRLVHISMPEPGTNHPHETGFFYLDPELPTGNLVIGRVRVEALGAQSDGQWKPTHVRVGTGKPRLVHGDFPKRAEDLQDEIRTEAKRVEEKMREREREKSKPASQVVYQQQDPTQREGSMPTRGGGGSIPRRSRPSGTA